MGFTAGPWLQQAIERGLIDPRDLTPTPRPAQEVRKLFRHYKRVRSRSGRERQWVYEGITWFESRPESLLLAYDRLRRETSTSLSATAPGD